MLGLHACSSQIPRHNASNNPCMTAWAIHHYSTLVVTSSACFSSQFYCYSTIVYIPSSYISWHILCSSWWLCDKISNCLSCSSLSINDAYVDSVSYKECVCGSLIECSMLTPCWVRRPCRLVCKASQPSLTLVTPNFTRHSAQVWIIELCHCYICYHAQTNRIMHVQLSDFSKLLPS